MDEFLITLTEIFVPLIDLVALVAIVAGTLECMVLAVRAAVSGGSVTVRVVCDARLLTVDVMDTGIGIAPEEADLIFERFYRSQDKRLGEISGTGLGLTIAREVIRLHGGDITVRSQLNQGSTFSLSMPLAAQAA